VFLSWDLADKQEVKGEEAKRRGKSISGRYNQKLLKPCSRKEQQERKLRWMEVRKTFLA
jgi:hypothetical protein